VIAICGAAPPLVIIKPFLNFIIGRIIEFALDKTELGIFFKYIDLRTSEQGREFEKAALNHSNKLKDGTDEEKKLAEKDLILAFKRFAKFSS
jgi:hypothetical protein